MKVVLRHDVDNVGNEGGPLRRLRVPKDVALFAREDPDRIDYKNVKPAGKSWSWTRWRPPSRHTTS